MAGKNIDETEAWVGRAFRYDRADGEPDEDRVRRIMRRIRSEIAAREITLFIFVRMWLAVLEFGAAVYAAASRRPRIHGDGGPGRAGQGT